MNTTQKKSIPRQRCERCIVSHADLHYASFAEQIMGMPATHGQRWTRKDIERLMEERDGYTPRYELVDGELLVTPAPNRRHQRVVVELTLLLHRYARSQRLGEASLGPGEIALDGESRFEPDIFVAPAIDGRRASGSDPVSNPLLICEVLSPGSARHDRITKRHAFQRHGVPEYWIIDSNAEAFEVWRPGDERATLVDDVLTWHPPGCQEPFTLDVRAFFADLADNAPLA